uniref:Uncharacterized protein n=1 Tax=Vitis vinifera TaxID=29760 RepID=F6HFZ3_VITVI
MMHFWRQICGGSGCHSNTRGNRTEVVPRNNRSRETIYMGF